MLAPWRRSRCFSLSIIARTALAADAIARPLSPAALREHLRIAADLPTSRRRWSAHAAALASAHARWTLGRELPLFGVLVQLFLVSAASETLRLDRPVMRGHVGVAAERLNAFGYRRRRPGSLEHGAGDACSRLARALPAQPERGWRQAAATAMASHQDTCRSVGRAAESELFQKFVFSHFGLSP